MLSEENKANIEKSGFIVNHELSQVFRSNDREILITAAFILYNKNVNPEINIESSNCICNSPFFPECIKEAIRKIEDSIWPTISEINVKFSDEDLYNYIIYYKGDNKYKGDSETPDCLLDLIAQILQIKKNDDVLDIGCGAISLFVSLIEKNIFANFCGIDIDSTILNIAYFKAYLLKTKIQLENKNIFEKDSLKKYDKIFSNYPFFFTADFAMQNYRNNACKRFNASEEVFQKASSDWLFNTKIIELLSDEGKAVAIMRNGSTWNRPDTKIREFFVENGYIEAVIELPNKLFDSFSISTTLLVMSKNNKGVRMIDAGQLCEKSGKGKVNVITANYIDDIITLLSSDDKNSVFKTTDEIAECEYVLNPSRYLSTTPVFDEGVQLKEFSSISRGAQLKADAIEEMKSEAPTNYRYITLADISDGSVKYNDSQYIMAVDKKLTKYCISKNSIVISKIGSPNFKSAVVTPGKDEFILINGNLYIINLDEDKADANYIQAFLDSNSGRAILNNLYTGTAMKTLPVKDLSDVKIPLPEMEIQKEIGMKYAETVKKVYQLKKTLVKETAKMRKIFDESYEEVKNVKTD